MVKEGFNNEYRLVAFNARFVHSCPAIFHVRQELEKSLPDSIVSLQQWTINDPYYETLLKVSSGSPSAILFSVYIWNSAYVARLLRDLGKLIPHTDIVLGGPQAGQLLRDNSDIAGPVLVVGEIEAIGPDFFKDLVAGNLRPVYSAEPGRFSDACFLLPYRGDDFMHELANRYIYYESSRGCPFTCTYCLSSGDTHVRHKDLRQVEEELQGILVHRPGVVRFIDRTFNDIPERALRIWRFLAEQPGETLFHFEVAPDRFSDEMFVMLADLPPGKFQFEIGIQSTSHETLQLVRRKTDLARSRKNIIRLSNLDNIHLHVDLILGLPGENRDSFMRSFRDVFAMRPHYIQMGLLKILPDTRISREIEEFGIVCRKEPPYEILYNRWLNPVELAELYWFCECVEAFYNNRFFRSVWEYLLHSQQDPSLFFGNLLDVCRKNKFFEFAATQELMLKMLLLLVDTREDRELLRELLVYDWLRSANRQLPDFFLEDSGSFDQAVLKKKLRLELPQVYPALYNYKDRDHFLKRTSFVILSDEALRYTGLGESAGGGCVAMVKSHGQGVLGLSEAVLLSY